MHIPHEEYYQVNGPRIESITKTIDEFIGGQEDTFHTTNIPGGEQVIIGGLATAEQVREAYLERDIEVPPELSQELADIHNEKLSAKISISIGGILTRVSMRCAAEFYSANPTIKEVPWNNDDNPIAPLVPYAQANSKIAYWDSEDREESVEATSIRITGVNGHHTVTEHDLTIEDPLITQVISFGSFDKQMYSAHFDIKPTEDALVRRCIQLLGQEHASATMLLAGSFESEDDLDVALNELWLAHQTKFSEEEVGPLLDEVRQRALAARHARELSHEHNLGLPNYDTLLKVEGLLEDMKRS